MRLHDHVLYSFRSYNPFDRFTSYFKIDKYIAF